MSATIHRAINDLLNGRLFTIDLSPVPPIAWQGVKFEHTELPTGSLWLKTDLFFNDPDNRFLGSEKPLLIGLYQVAVNQKQRDGSVAYDIGLLADTANAVVDHFGPGTVLSNDDHSLRIETSPFVSAPLVDDGVMSIPVTVPWVVRAAY